LFGPPADSHSAAKK